MSWETGLDTTLDHVWETLRRGVAESQHPARQPTFGTIGHDGPQLRTVVLRGARRAVAELEVHTDKATTKVSEIAIDPRVSFHIWAPAQDLQLRLMGRARLIHCDATRWAAIPPDAQIVYGGTPTPATPIAQPQDHTPGATLERFTAIVVTLTRIETVHLGTTQHRRAEFVASDQWAGQWLAP